MPGWRTTNVLFQSNHQYVLRDSESTMNFIGGSNDLVLVAGSMDTIMTGRTTDLAVWDMGHGTTLQISQFVRGMTVQDFASDLTGRVQVLGGMQVTYASDGFGGTEMFVHFRGASYANGWVDFRGVSEATLAARVTG